MEEKIISIPYSMFKIDDRIFWIDSHFPGYLSENFRISALIKESVSEYAEGKVLDVKIDPDTFPKFVEELIPAIERKLRSIRAERSKKMGRWSLARLLLIPLGHTKKIAEDEELSKKERELLISLQILKKISRSKYCNKIGYFNLKIVNKKPSDSVYSKLMMVDEGFRKKMEEYIQ